MRVGIVALESTERRVSGFVRTGRCCDLRLPGDSTRERGLGIPPRDRGGGARAPLGAATHHEPIRLRTGKGVRQDNVLFGRKLSGRSQRELADLGLVVEDGSAPQAAEAPASPVHAR